MESTYCENCNGLGTVSGKPCGICQGACKVKRCSSCQSQHPATIIYFYRNRSTADRLSNCCKKCTNAANHQTSYIAKLNALKGTIGTSARGGR